MPNKKSIQYYNIILIFLHTFISSDLLLSQNIYFGDLHVHSNLSFDGTINIDSLYYKARYSNNYDFICISDHDISSTNSIWETAKQKVNEYYDPGYFVTLLGYEYTRSDSIGHRIIYYPTNNAPRFGVNQYNVFSMMDSVNKYNGIVHIAHPDYHNISASLYTYNPNVTRNIEIFGAPNQYRFEYFGNPNAAPNQRLNRSVQNWLANQRLLGFLGVSDLHSGSLDGKGLTAVIADSLTRESIFEAIRKRNVYATSGGAKIKLRFSSGDYIMGDSIGKKIGTQKDFIFSCVGTNKIEKIEVIKNNNIFMTYFPNNITYESQFSDIDSLEYSYYYLRVTQIDGKMAWSSPIYFFQDEYIPVNIESFSAQNIENKIMLKWIINNEVNIKGYRIEKKYIENWDDIIDLNNNWLEIGFVDNDYRNSEKKEYSFIDYNIAKHLIYYKLSAINYAGEVEYSQYIKVNFMYSYNFELLQNYPNPFNSSTIISFNIAEKGIVILRIYDLLGNLINTLVEDEYVKGNYNIIFNADKLNSGVYFYELIIKNEYGMIKDRKKMVLLK